MWESSELRAILFERILVDGEGIEFALVGRSTMTFYGQARLRSCVMN